MGKEIHPSAQEFGRQFVDFARMDGKTQAELAVLLKSKPANIRSIKRGEAIPSLDDIGEYIQEIEIRPEEYDYFYGPLGMLLAKYQVPGQKIPQQIGNVYYMEFYRNRRSSEATENIMKSTS